jgi:hypothetical protein
VGRRLVQPLPQLSVSPPRSECRRQLQIEIPCELANLVGANPLGLALSPELLAFKKKPRRWSSRARVVDGDLAHLFDLLFRAGDRVPKVGERVGAVAQLGNLAGPILPVKSPERPEEGAMVAVEKKPREDEGGDLQKRIEHSGTMIGRPCRSSIGGCDVRQMHAMAPAQIVVALHLDQP